MKTILVTFLKLSKSVLFIPFIILDLVRKNFVTTSFEIMDLFRTSLIDSFSPILSYFNIKNLFFKVLSTIKFVLKMIFILTALAFISFFICLLINSVLVLPNQLSQELEFRFSQDYNSLYSEVYLSSDACYIHPDRTCIELDKYSYDISFQMEIANKNYPKNSENYELEVSFINKSGKNRVVRRLFYFNKFDDFSEFFNKILTLPLRVFGLLNRTDKIINVIDDYDNYYHPLEKVEITIRNKNLNLKNTTISFMPKIGFLKLLLSYFRLFAIPALFFFLIVAQAVFFFILCFFFKKETIHSIN